MHARQRRRLAAREFLHEVNDILGVGVVVHHPAGRLARPQDVRLDNRGHLMPTLCEEVACEQGPRRGLEHESAIPAMGQLRRVDPLHLLLAKRQDLPVTERAWRPDGLIVRAHVHADVALDCCGLGGGFQPLVQRT